MARYEVGYEGKDGKGHKFTFKSDKQLAYHSNWNYGIGMPMWIDMGHAQSRIEKREGTIMNRVGFKFPRYIKNTETGYVVHFA